MPVALDQGVTGAIRALILAGLASQDNAKRLVKAPAPEQLPFSDLLEQTLGRVDDLLASALPGDPSGGGGLDYIKGRLEDELEGTPADAVEDPKSLADLRERVSGTNELLLLLTPTIAALTTLVDKHYWLPDLADKLAGEAKRIRHLYLTAVLNEWFFPHGWQAPKYLDEAEAAAAKFPALVVDSYLGDTTPVSQGIERQVELMVEVREEVADLRHQNGGPDDSWRKAVEMAGVYPPPNWDEEFTNQLAAVRTARKAGITPELQTKVRELSAQIQMVQGILNVLRLDQQLLWWKENLWFGGGAVGTRLDGYRAKVDEVLKTFEKFDVDTDQGHIYEGLKAVGPILNDPQFKLDIEEIGDKLDTQAVVKMALIATAIVAAAAFTAGAAAGLAGAAIEAGLGVGLAVGTGSSTTATIAAWASAGAFATEVIVFTVMTREGNELVFGSDPAHETPLWEDLLWNAAMMGSLKVVEAGYATAFKQLATGAKATTATKVVFQAGRITAANVSMHAFAEFQVLVKEGEFMSGEKRYKTVLQELVMLVAMEGGRFMMKPFADRAKAAAAKVAQAKRQQLEADRVALADLVKRMEGRKASTEEVRELIEKTDALRRDELKAIDDALPPTDPQNETPRDEALKAYEQNATEIELRLAEMGQATEGTTRDRPDVEPLAPGVVEYQPGARARLEQIYADRGGTFKPSRFKGLYEGRLPTGELMFFVEGGGKRPLSVPAASRLAVARDLARSLIEGPPPEPGEPPQQPIDPVAKEGLRVLNELFGSRKVDDVLASAPPEAMLPLLRLLAGGGITSQFSARELMALAQSPKAIDFARTYGAELLQKVKGTATLKSVEPLLEKVAAKIETGATPDARQKIIADLMAAKSRPDLVKQLPNAKPPKEKLPLPTKDDLSVSRASREWRRLYAEYKKLWGTTYPDETIKQWADIQQVLDAAKLKRYRGWSHDDKLGILEKFDQMCGQAGIPVGERNSLRGSLAEYLFIESRIGVKKKVWLRGVEKPWGTKDATVPDDWYQVGGIWEGLNLKSDRLPDLSVADLRARAEVYFKKALKEGALREEGGTQTGNQPKDSRYALWFLRAPKDAAGMQAMMEVFQKAGSKVTRVRFGLGEWKTVVVTPGP